MRILSVWLALKCCVWSRNNLRSNPEDSGLIHNPPLDFCLKWILGLDSLFIGITLYGNFDCSIESIILNFVGLNMSLVCIEFWMNSEYPMGDLDLPKSSLYAWAGAIQNGLRIRKPWATFIEPTQPNGCIRGDHISGVLATIIVPQFLLAAIARPSPCL